MHQAAQDEQDRRRRHVAELAEDGAGVGEVLLARTPVISGLYKGLRQIFETLFSANGTSFRTVGLVEFPVKGTWSVVFLSAPAAPDVQTALAPGGDHVGVFLPCPGVTGAH